MNWWDRFAYIWNRTALGLAVLTIGWFVWKGSWLRAGVMVLAIPVYFWLHDRFGAP